MPRVVVVISPASGPKRRAPAERRALAHEVLERHGFDVDAVVTAAPGDARAIAERAVGAGADLVVAWGGDGTINEVGSALAFSAVPLAIVPGGSGNGLARDLGVPLDASAALELAATSRPRLIDAGEVDGALFFNVAGLGLDAVVADRLARPGARRGLSGYVRATLIELPRYRARSYMIVADGTELCRDAWFVALANSRQYGSGAQIAPGARLDDEQLDLIVVEPQSLFRLLPRVRALFHGTLGPGPGLDMARFRDIEIRGESPILYHLDGEPGRGGPVIRARVRPRALWVRSP